MSQKQFKKLVNGKNTKKWVTVKVKTNKYVKQRVGHYKNKLKTVKARVSIIISYGGKTGAQDVEANKYKAYLDTPYQNPGYDYCIPWVSGSKKVLK